MLEYCIALLAPHICLVCGAEGSLLCEWCAPDGVSPVPSRCYRCFVLTPDAGVCRSCRRQTSLEHVWVRTLYAGAPRELMYALKFSRAKAAAKIIAGLVDETVPYLPTDTVITFVPTATSRIRMRGYDQTKLIAKELARLRGLRCRPLLIRRGQTRQVGASRAQRARQAAQNYSARSTDGVTTVLVVDDILTTGATLESIAQILKDRGIKHVYGAVFAQKQ